uniref:cytochrome P450 2K1-like n=1 Tax=Monopterus albus TaxID=43700 RepID=UPI0009B2F932|nr:cytochrome P450 2K1-like [Monopterus albus]
MVHFVPLPKLPSAKETAQLIVLHVFRLHGLPRDVVSDRSPQFVVHFWNEFCQLLGISGTTVYPLLTSVLYDETEWERPHSFYPAHFLDKDGKFVKRDAFMPFSAGHRICLGESLARMELFIFFTTLLQHFRFTPPPGVSEDELDLTPRVGLSLNPLPHKLCAVSCL